MPWNSGLRTTDSPRGLQVTAEALWSGLKFASITHSEGSGQWLFSRDTDPPGFLPPHCDLFKSDSCLKSVETKKALSCDVTGNFKLPRKEINP